jgi:hypothetical protein
VLANTVHSTEMWQRNHENINREIANQYPEVWEEILALRAQGVRSLTPEVQALYRIHSVLVRFYNPANVSKLLSEPDSRNEELYRAFAGDDIEFILGGQVALLPDLRPRLKELTMPTLILAGRFDRALYPAMQIDFRRFAPQARFVMLEQSGSFGHIEEPDQVRLVREFLSSGPPASTHSHGWWPGQSPAAKRAFWRAGPRLACNVRPQWPRGSGRNRPLGRSEIEDLTVRRPPVGRQVAAKPAEDQLTTSARTTTASTA